MMNFWNTFDTSLHSELVKKHKLNLVTLTKLQIQELKKITNTLGVTFPEELYKKQVLSKTLNQYQVTQLDLGLDSYYKSICLKHDSKLNKIPLTENSEPIVDIKESHNIKLTPETPPFKKIFKARQTMANKLNELAINCQKLQLGIVVLDAYRSYETQEKKFKDTFQRLKTLHPKQSTEQLLKLAGYNTACAPWMAAHMSAAALDIHLYHLKTKQNLNIGNAYRSLSYITHMNYPFLDFEQFKNRFIFQMVCNINNLAIYHAENWHVSYGDADWAYQNAKPNTLYQPLKNIYKNKAIYLKESQIKKNFNI